MTNATCSMSKSPSSPETHQVSYVRSFQAQINNLLDEITGATSDLEKRITAILMPSRPTDTARDEEKAVRCETSNLAEELAVVKARLEEHLAFINDLRDRVDL